MQFHVNCILFFLLSQWLLSTTPHIQSNKYYLTCSRTYTYIDKSQKNISTFVKKNTVFNKESEPFRLQLENSLSI